MKRSSFKSCLFSEGDVVRVSGSRFPAVVVGTRPFDGEDIRESIVVVRSVMTGHPVTRLMGGHKGLVSREVQAGKLTLVCRSPSNTLKEGDPVVVFPLIKVPHVSVEMRLLEQIFAPSRYSSGTVKVRVSSSEETLRVNKKLIHLSSTKLTPVRVGDIVTVRASVQRGRYGNVYEIDEEGVLTVGFCDRKDEVGMVAQKFKMGELIPYQRIEDLGRLTVVCDSLVVSEPRRRPLINRIFVDEIVV